MNKREKGLWIVLITGLFLGFVLGIFLGGSISYHSLEESLENKTEIIEIYKYKCNEHEIWMQIEYCHDDYCWNGSEKTPIQSCKEHYYEKEIIKTSGGSK